MSENISLSTYTPGVFVGGRGVIYCGSFFGDRSSRTSGGKAAELEKYGSLSPRSSDIPYPPPAAKGGTRAIKKT